MDVSAAWHRRPSRLGGGGLGEVEGEDPLALGGEGEACLCVEMLPGRGQQRWSQFIKMKYSIDDKSKTTQCRFILQVK